MARDRANIFKLKEEEIEKFINLLSDFKKEIFACEAQCKKLYGYMEEDEIKKHKEFCRKITQDRISRFESSSIS